VKRLTRVRHILIDLDGTLLGARDLPLTLDFLKQTITALKVHGGWFRAMRAIRRVKSELQAPPKRIQGEARTTNEFRAVEIFSRAIGLPAAQAAEVLKKTVPSIFPSLQRHFFPMAQAHDFLDWAEVEFGRRGLTLATNPVWPLELVKMRMAWADIDPERFGYITHAGVMHSTKPHLEYYEEILEQLKLKPEECCLIGNDVKMDLPATRAGIPVFIVTAGRKDLEMLKSVKSCAPAWKGSFPAIRQALESVR